MIRCLLLAALCMSIFTPAMAQRSQFPAALQGVWFPVSSEGASQCKRYLRNPEDDTVWAGQVAVRADTLNEYAEYGEGAEHRLSRLQANGRTSWLAHTRYALDGEDSQGSDTLRLSLTAGLLVIEHARSAPARGWEPAQRYRRCRAKAD